MAEGPSFPKGTAEKERIYYFSPSPFELVMKYLIPRLNHQLPKTDMIKDLDVYRYDADQIPLSKNPNLKENEGYFFVPDKAYFQGEIESESTRRTPNGYWEFVEKDVLLFNRDENYGFMDQLVFYYGQSNGFKTEWEMTEYRVHPLLALKHEEKIVVSYVKNNEKDEEEGDAAASGVKNGNNGGDAEVEDHAS